MNSILELKKNQFQKRGNTGVDDGNCESVTSCFISMDIDTDDSFGESSSHDSTGMVL